MVINCVNRLDINKKIFLAFPTGPVVGKFCIDLAIKKAKQTGVGWVCATGKYS